MADHETEYRQIVAGDLTAPTHEEQLRWGERQVLALESIADSLVDIAHLLASPAPEYEEAGPGRPPASAPEGELLPGAGKPLTEDGWTPGEEECAAVIELLEDEGVVVPASAYKALGLDSPRREDDPVVEEFEERASAGSDDER